MAACGHSAGRADGAESTVMTIQVFLITFRAVSIKYVMADWDESEKQRHWGACLMFPASRPQSKSILKHRNLIVYFLDPNWEYNQKWEWLKGPFLFLLPVQGFLLIIWAVHPAIWIYFFKAVSRWFTSLYFYPFPALMTQDLSTVYLSSWRLYSVLLYVQWSLFWIILPLTSVLPFVK